MTFLSLKNGEFNIFTLKTFYYVNIRDMFLLDNNVEIFMHILENA